MLALVLDDSGSHDGAKYCSSVGIVAGQQHWKRFDREWREVLAKEGVADLHARRFFARDRHGSRVGKYRGWDDKRAWLFLGSLMAKFACMKATIVGATVENAAFARISERERAFLTGQLVHKENLERTWGTGAPSKPFILAFMTTVLQAVEHGRCQLPVAVVMDQQDSFAPQAKVMCRQINADSRTRNLIPGFYTPSRTDFVSLQLADVIAYTLNRLLTKARLTKEHELVLDYVSRKSHSVKLFDETGLAVFREGTPTELKQLFAAGHKSSNPGSA